MESNNIKSGFKSSEFYLTLAQSITGIFVMMGFLSPQEADNFVQALVSVIGGLMIIVPTVVYLYGRIALKKEIVLNGTQSTTVPTDGMLGDVPVTATTNQDSPKVAL